MFKQEQRATKVKKCLFIISFFLKNAHTFLSYLKNALQESELNMLSYSTSHLEILAGHPVKKLHACGACDLTSSSHTETWKQHQSFNKCNAATPDKPKPNDHNTNTPTTTKKKRPADFLFWLTVTSTYKMPSDDDNEQEVDMLWLWLVSNHNKNKICLAFSESWFSLNASRIVTWGMSLIHTCIPHIF